MPIFPHLRQLGDKLWCLLLCFQGQGICWLKPTYCQILVPAPISINSKWPPFQYCIMPISPHRSHVGGKFWCLLPCFKGQGICWLHLFYNKRLQSVLISINSKWLPFQPYSAYVSSSKIHRY